MTEQNLPSVAFIGLGAMGFPMAGHLQRAGHETAVYNRTTATASRWHSQYGGSTAATPAMGKLLVFVPFTAPP